MYSRRRTLCYSLATPYQSGSGQVHCSVVPQVNAKSLFQWYQAGSSCCCWTASRLLLFSGLSSGKVLNSLKVLLATRFFFHKHQNTKKKLYVVKRWQNGFPVPLLWAPGCRFLCEGKIKHYMIWKSMLEKWKAGYRIKCIIHGLWESWGKTFWTC